MDAFLVSLTIIFLAELGDKSQLMALVFATRFTVGTVLAGITVATLVIHGLSVGVGAAVGAAVPERPVTIVAALAFAGFGLWTLWDDDEADLDEPPTSGLTRHAAVAVAGSVLLAELGDKTMLASAALATGQHPVPTWLGASAGMVIADALAIVVGRQLGHRLPQGTLRIGAAIAFFAFAAILAARAVGLGGPLGASPPVGPAALPAF